MIASLALLLLVCGAGSAVLARWMIGYARRRNMVDHVNERSSHAAPTPRGGGVAIIVSALAGFVAAYALYGGVAAFLIGALGGAFAVAMIGWIDDNGHVNAALRLGVHLLAAAWLVGWTVDMEMLGLRDNLTARIVVGGLLTLLVAWSINLYNFMDGIDGLAASETVFVASGAALILYMGGPATIGPAMPALVLAVAASGFLLWNWPPARIFMGDASSGFLGFMMAALVLLAIRRDLSQGVAVALLYGTFIVDTGVTLARRLVRGQAVHQAHRSHAYQILSRRWQSHRRVTLANLAMNLGWLAPLAGMASARIVPAIPTFFAGLLPLAVVAWYVGAGREDT